jgi:hypothetical protein
LGAVADCEAIGTGFLGQPVNALSTIAFLVAGGIVIARAARLRWVGIASIATGIGSFLFHGPMPPGSQWAHDATLAWLLIVVAGVGSRWEGITRLPAAVAVGVFCAMFPTATDPLAVVLTVVVLTSLLTRDRSGATVSPLLLLASVAVFGRLGATGQVLCDPGSWFQPHVVWHIGSATALLWWALNSRVDGRRADSPSPEPSR